MPPIHHRQKNSKTPMSLLNMDLKVLLKDAKIKGHYQKQENNVICFFSWRAMEREAFFSEVITPFIST